MTVGRILLVGTEGVGLPELLAAIRGQEGGPGDSPHAWIIDNKYYTAAVEFDVRHVEQCSGLRLQEGGWEALVLTFDATQPASFASVQRWYEEAGSGGDDDLGVTLAVGTGAAAGDARPAWLQQAEDWCAEQLVEYVETGYMGDEEVEDAAAAASAGSGAEEGATGVRRIREALHAHMWPGMQLKPSPRHGSVAIAADAAAEAEEAEAAVVAAVAQQQQQHANGSALQAAAAPAAANGGPPSGAAGQEGFTFSQYLQAPETAAAAGAAGAAGGGAEEEAEVEQLEQLFMQVASKDSEGCRRCCAATGRL